MMYGTEVQQKVFCLKNIMVGMIFSEVDSLTGKNPHWKMVRDAQVKVAEDEPSGAWVDTDDLNNKKDKDGNPRNGLHYTGAGYQMLGQRFAEKSIELIKKQK